MNKEPKPKESLLDGDFSCETTEDIFEQLDDSLSDQSENTDWVYVRSPKSEMTDDWKCINGMLYPF